MSLLISIGANNFGGVHSLVETHNCLFSLSFDCMLHSLFNLINNENLISKSIKIYKIDTYLKNKCDHRRII